MQELHQKRFDLNLLTIFVALMEERHVGRAGERLALTQPAVSHALGRLRVLAGDPLFVKHARGMTPTARALEIAATAVPALAELRASVLARPRFQPQSEARTFALGASDYVDLTLMPAVVARLRAQAPSIDLRLTAVSRAEVGTALRRREIDLAIGPMAAAPEDVHTQPLFAERFVMIARPAHPGLAAASTIEGFAALPHLLVSPQGDATGTVDQALRDLGLRRRVALVVPHFAAAPLLVESSDLVAVMPERVAGRLRGAARFCQHELPLRLPPWTVGLARARDSASDAGLDWLCALIAEAAAGR